MKKKRLLSALLIAAFAFQVKAPLSTYAKESELKTEDSSVESEPSGWVTLDDGYYQYYRDGECLVGKHFIYAIPYDFDEDGKTKQKPINFFTWYRIQGDDDWWKLSHQYHTNPWELSRMNKLEKLGPLLPGTVIRLPER